MLVIGGRTNDVGVTLGLEIYDTETSDWVKFSCNRELFHFVYKCINVIDYKYNVYYFKMLSAVTLPTCIMDSRFNTIRLWGVRSRIA